MPLFSKVAGRTLTTDADGTLTTGILPTVKTSERDWQKLVTDYARLRGWLVLHVPRTTARRQGRTVHMTAVAYDGAGFPDLYMVRGDRVVIAELKSDTGRLSAEQERWIATLRAAGQDVRVWRPKDWPEVESELM